MQITKWLIVRADGDVRITTRWPSRFRLNEIAFRLLIHAPQGWGKQGGTIELTIPEGSVEITASEAICPEPEIEVEPAEG